MPDRDQSDGESAGVEWDDPEQMLGPVLEAMRSDGPDAARGACEAAARRLLRPSNGQDDARIAHKLSYIPEWLIDHLGDLHPFALNALAVNPAASEGLLRRLGSEADPGVFAEVRRELGANPSCPADLLTVLAADSDRFCRWRVANNPSTPAGLLHQLADDPDQLVAEAASRQLASRDWHTSDGAMPGCRVCGATSLDSVVADTTGSNERGIGLALGHAELFSRYRPVSAWCPDHADEAPDTWNLPERHELFRRHDASWFLTGATYLRPMLRLAAGAAFIPCAACGAQAQLLVADEYGTDSIACLDDLPEVRHIHAEYNVDNRRWYSDGGRLMETSRGAPPPTDRGRYHLVGRQGSGPANWLAYAASTGSVHRQHGS